MGQTKAGDGYNMEEILSSIRKMIIEQDEKLNKIENSEDNKKLDVDAKSTTDTEDKSEEPKKGRFAFLKRKKKKK